MLSFLSSKPTEDNSSDSDEDECQVFEPENTSAGLSSEEMKMDVDNHEGIYNLFLFLFFNLSSLLVWVKLIRIFKSLLWNIYIRY